MKSRRFESQLMLTSVALSLLVCACSSSGQSGSPASGGSTSGGSTSGGNGGGGAQAGSFTSGGSTSGGSTSGSSTSGGSTSGGNGGGGAQAGGAGGSVSGAGGVATAGGDNGGGTGGSSGAAGAGGAHSAKSYLCNVFLGVSVTHDWFVAGFESAPGVDNARWEAMASAQADVSFIQTWADPTSTLWNMAKLSPCSQNAALPDRVILVGVNWDYTTQTEWEAAYEKVLTTIEAKFPGVKEIDLMTLLRSPGNVSCGSVESVVQPFVDQAIAAEVSKHPDLVRAAPKFYAPDCSVFTGGGPHFTAAGAKVVAGVYGAYYGMEP